MHWCIQPGAPTQSRHSAVYSECTCVSASLRSLTCLLSHGGSSSLILGSRALQQPGREDVVLSAMVSGRVRPPGCCSRAPLTKRYCQPMAHLPGRERRSSPSPRCHHGRVLRHSGFFRAVEHGLSVGESYRHCNVPWVRFPFKQPINQWKNSATAAAHLNARGGVLGHGCVLAAALASARLGAAAFATICLSTAAALAATACKSATHSRLYCVLSLRIDQKGGKRHSPLPPVPPPLATGQGASLHSHRSKALHA